MTKVLDPALKEALTATTTTLCWCWLITRVDGQQLGFTNLDIPFVIDGVTYLGITGFDPTAAQQSQGLDQLDSQNLKGILDASGISEAELKTGIFDNAEVRRFLINYLDIPSSLSLEPPKHLELPRGFFASIKQNSLGYEIQTKDNLSKLDNQIGTTTSKTCRANLGDKICQKDLTNFTHNLTVTAVESKRIFSVDGSHPNTYFDRGRLRFTSGANNLLHLDIAYYANNRILMFQPAPFEISVGDTLTAVAGCRKTKLDCITKFENYAFFFGEPDIPTTDIAVNTPND